MKLFKVLVLPIAAFSPVTAHALDYTSTFSDNGNITTETRTYNAGAKNGLIEIWEWLDLTITNGFSYNEIAADLADDNRLNHSVASLANANQVADLLSLSTQEQGDWAYASIQDVADQYSAFFNIIVDPASFYLFNANIPSVERYIGLFGDTYHEGEDDIDPSYYDVDPSLANIGFSLGLSNTNVNAEYIYASYVFDGQYHYSNTDRYEDRVFTNDWRFPENSYYQIGSYLTRQTSTTQVSEPATISLFALALAGLVAFRRKLVQK